MTEFKIFHYIYLKVRALAPAWRAPGPRAPSRVPALRGWASGNNPREKSNRLQGPTAAVVEAALSSALGFVAFTSMVQAYWHKEASPLERALMGVAAFTLFMPGVKSDLLGLGLMVAVTLMQRFRK